MRQGWPVLIQCFAVLAALSASGCSRQADSEALAAGRVVAVSSLIGHSPAEVVAALIGKPVEDRGLYVSAVSRDGGTEVLVLNDSDVGRMAGVCPSFVLETDAPGDAGRFPLLGFAARRLVAIEHPSIPEPYGASTPDVPAAKILRWRCLNTKPTTLSDAGMVVAAIPLFAAVTPEAVKLRTQYLRGRQALSQLSLGAPVSGGVAAFARARPSVATAVDRPDGAVDLQIDMGLRHLAPGDGGPYAIHVLVRDGRVVSFAKGYLAGDLACRLEAAKLRCLAPDFYQ